METTAPTRCRAAEEENPRRPTLCACKGNRHDGNADVGAQSAPAALPSSSRRAALAVVPEPPVALVIALCGPDRPTLVANLLRCTTLLSADSLTQIRV
jgi:hypothetical protein